MKSSLLFPNGLPHCLAFWDLSDLQKRSLPEMGTLLFQRRPEKQLDRLGMVAQELARLGMVTQELARLGMVTQEHELP